MCFRAREFRRLFRNYHFDIIIISVIIIMENLPMYSPIRIGVSAKQRARLRNGHRVRVSPPVEGEGVNLIIHPDKINPISKCFRMGKGTMIQLSPSEIQANRVGVEGGGIFDDIGSAFSSIAKSKVGKDIGKAGVDMAVGSAGRFLPPSVARALGSEAKRQIDGYGFFDDVGSAFSSIAKSKVGKDIGRAGVDMAVGSAGRFLPPSVARALGNEAKRQIDGYGFLDDAMKLGKSKVGKSLQKTAIDMAMKEAKKKGVPSVVADALGSAAKSGVAGQGLYASAPARGQGVMGRGAMMGCGMLPPALQSQNNSANFHFSTQLPPSYAELKRYGMGGEGLYA